jgi:hypothetical protein
MAGAAACQSSGLLVAAAKRVAAAYVAADTVGRARAADSLVNWRDCDFDPGTDYLQVTTAARLTDAVVRGDTVDVTIEYDVIGRAWSEDHKRAGENNWRFAAGRLTDKLVLHVLPPSRGRPPIACGEYQANHIALSRMGGEISRMDDASRTALEQAKRASK